MKSMFNNLVVLITLSIICVNANAQIDGRQRMTREQLAEAQAKYIVREIAMNDTTAAHFIETFCQFQKEVWALGPRPQRDSSNHSDADAEQAMKERFEHSQRILDLRKKYYKEYSKFLTQKQIEQVYKLEKEMMERLYHRSQNRNAHQK